jgi:hypothetical protein
MLLTIHGPENSKYPSPVPEIYWGDKIAVLMLDEPTGQDLAAQWYQAGVAIAKTGNILVDPWSLDLYVGWPNGQHSGEDQCVMRYSLAEVYPMGNDPEAVVYYAVPPGTEPAGLQICSTGNGTGVNDVGRKPQSRYFDTEARHGSCKFWVCVNDAIPPDPD